MRGAAGEAAAYYNERYAGPCGGLPRCDEKDMHIQRLKKQVDKDQEDLQLRYDGYEHMSGQYDVLEWQCQLSHPKLHDSTAALASTERYVFREDSENRFKLFRERIQFETVPVTFREHVSLKLIVQFRGGARGG